MWRTIILFCFTLTLAAVASGQRRTEVGNTEQKIKSHIESKMPGWKHRRQEGIPPSSKHVTEVWSFLNKSVRATVVRYETSQGAKDVLRNFLKFESNKEEINGLGDEAYAWGVGRAEVVFVRGAFLVYVESAIELSDATLITLGPKESSIRERSESKQLSIEFARLMVEAIDLP